ncbi:MAG: peptide deformylase [Verrucomicrobiota bacterium]
MRLNAWQGLFPSIFDSFTLASVERSSRGFNVNCAACRARSLESGLVLLAVHIFYDRIGGYYGQQCAIQHETDHLSGILFIDRINHKTKEELRPELDELQAKTKAELESAGNR